MVRGDGVHCGGDGAASRDRYVWMVSILILTVNIMM